jgi:hypothetical protein
MELCAQLRTCLASGLLRWLSTPHAAPLLHPASPCASHPAACHSPGARHPAAPLYSPGAWHLAPAAACAAELHGDMTQAARLESLEDFRAGRCLLCLFYDSIGWSRPAQDDALPQWLLWNLPEVWPLMPAAGKAAFLLATDVAARGLDVQGVQVTSSPPAPPGSVPVQHAVLLSHKLCRPF